MNDKMKYVLLGLAVVAALGIGTVMYQRMAPANQTAFDSTHAGPPAYAKSKSSETYGATVGGSKSSAGGPPGAGGRPMYSGPGGSGGGRPGGPPSYGPPR